MMFWRKTPQQFVVFEFTSRLWTHLALLPSLNSWFQTLCLINILSACYLVRSWAGYHPELLAHRCSKICHLNCVCTLLNYPGFPGEHWRYFIILEHILEHTLEHAQEITIMIKRGVARHHMEWVNLVWIWHRTLCAVVSAYRLADLGGDWLSVCL